MGSPNHTRYCFLVAILLAACGTSARFVHDGWTENAVAHLTISLIHPTNVEFLEFAPKGKVAVRWGTRSLSTNPWLDWKLINGRIRIYEDGNVAEELTLLRREGSFLIIRMGSGKVGRFKIITENR
jgi:hypothetical protein